MESVFGRCQNDVCMASAARNLILASASSRLHEAGGVDLHPLQVDGLRADLLAGTGSPTNAACDWRQDRVQRLHGGIGRRLAHLDAIARAVLAVGGGQVQQVGAVLGQQGVLGEVGAEATCSMNRPVQVDAEATRLACM